jgi:hypothetical protein
MIARNSVWLWAFVIFVRVPLLFPFWAVHQIGRGAETIGGWIGHKLPGIRP